MKNNKKLFMMIIPLVLLVSLLVFLGVLLQSQLSSDRQNLLNNLSKFSELQKNISDNLAKARLIAILNEEFLKEYNNKTNEVEKAIGSIEMSSFIKNDGAVKLIYGENKDILDDYVESNKNLAKAIELYLDVWKSCGDMGGKLDEIIAKQPTLKSADFVANSEDCRLALLAGSYAPDVSFNQQFFDAFRFNMESVFATYKSGFTENNADRAGFKLRVEGAWNEVLAMNSALLDLQRSPDPTGAIQALQEVVDEQKAGLF